MDNRSRSLPQLGDGRIFLTDGGIETTLIYHYGFDLPFFAAFPLLKTAEGREALSSYYGRHAAIAVANKTGFILESPTWRANADWGDKLGYGPAELADINREAIAFMSELRRRYETPHSPMPISGCIGPRGDGYDPGRMMGADEASAYHEAQIATFSATAADMVCAITMTYADEAIGIARAAAAAGMPAAISFTVETDGRLPTGQAIGEAIKAVDEATDAAPAYYMINCAHPTHFADTLAVGEAWTGRIRGVRANASRLSHAELDKATKLDAGDPVELGRSYASLRRKLGRLTVLGGCCGTDHRHIEQICLACTAVT
jgi:S-methylmethionine-dependent homocysteine/selenocysteine methylase